MTRLYRVKEGDTLTSIAWRFGLGVDWKRLLAAQPKEYEKKRPYPGTIRIGDELNIPNVETTPSTAPPNQTTALTVASQGAELIPLARTLHAAYVQKRDAFMKWQQEKLPLMTVRGILNSLLTGANGKRSREALSDNKYGQLVADNAQHAAEELKLVLSYEFAAHELVSILDLRAFAAQLRYKDPKEAKPGQPERTPAEQADILADVTERLEECAVGMAYLDRSMEGARPSSIPADAASDPTPDQDPGETTLLKVVKDANTLTTGVVRLFATCSPVIARRFVGRPGIDIALQFTTYVKRTFPVVSVETVLGSLSLTERPHNYWTIEVKERRFALPWFRAKESALVAAKDLPPVALATHKPFIRALAVLNFGLVTHELLKAGDEEKSIKQWSLANASAELMQTIVGSVDDLAGRSLRGGTLVRVLSIRALGVVSGVTSCVMSWKEYKKATAAGDDDAAMWHSVAAGSGALSTIAGGLLLASALTAKAGVAALPAPPVAALIEIVAAIAGIIGVIASLAAWWESDTPLETWVKQSHYGDHTVGDASTQIKRYQALFQGVTAKIHSKAWDHVFVEISIRYFVVGQSSLTLIFNGTRVLLLTPLGVMPQPPQHGTAENYYTQTHFVVSNSVTAKGNLLQRLVVSVPLPRGEKMLKITGGVDIKSDGTWAYSVDSIELERSFW